MAGISLVFAMLWAWMGLAHHLAFFTAISAPAYGFAAVFLASTLGAYEFPGLGCCVASIKDGPVTLTMLMRPWECGLSDYQRQDGLLIPMAGEAARVGPGPEVLAERGGGTGAASVDQLRRVAQGAPTNRPQQPWRASCALQTPQALPSVRPHCTR